LTPSGHPARPGAGSRPGVFRVGTTDAVRTYAGTWITW